MSATVGVYFCHCGGIVTEKIDPELVKAEVVRWPEVAYFSTINLMCSEDGLAELTADIAARAPERVVIAACSPREHERTFKRALATTTVNPFLMQMVNIREQVAWVTEDPAQAADKAVAGIRAAVRRVVRNLPLHNIAIETHEETLVIGAGPAGMRAALTLAEAGRKVVLVEKQPMIGGLPVRYEAVAPNMECGPCMLEPMMDQVLHGDGAHLIELLTMAEVTAVKGFLGNFEVTITQRPRFVSETSCIGCSMCAEACPVRVPNALNYGLDTKPAIAMPFLGALPNIPYLDPAVCVRATGEDCRACEETCPVPGTILLDDAPKTLERTVGSVIVATGADSYDCDVFPQLGHGTVPGVYSALEFERISAPSGPTNGRIARPDEGDVTRVAIVHCVGSLDTAHCDYCSAICCQVALKFNHLVRHRYPEAEITHFHRELTAPGKEAGRLLAHNRAVPLNTFVRYERLSDLQVTEAEGMRRVELRDGDRLVTSGAFDLVLLCPAMVPGADTTTLGDMLDVSRDRWGFFEELHSRMSPTTSKVAGIHFAGTCHGPKDIPGAIGDGLAASASVLAGITPGKTMELEPIRASVLEGRCSGCRVCLSVCPYRAISFDETAQSAFINNVICQGCGTCVAACPSGVITGAHFTSEQIYAEIEGILA
jgi:heterodisulfide reductase subunit A